MLRRLIIFSLIIAALPQASFAADRIAVSNTTVSVSENGDSVNVTITLDEPIIGDPATVIVPVSVSDASEVAISTNSLEWDASNWSDPQTLTISQVDDDINDGDIDSTVVLGAAVSGAAYYTGFDPSDITVTTLNDDLIVTKIDDTADGTCDADCSLREAIIASNAASTASIISVPAGTYTLTRDGAGADNGDFDFTNTSYAVSVLGAGSGSTIIDGGTGIDRLFDIASNAVVSMSGVTIQGGEADHTEHGGGILLNSGSTLELSDSVVQNNLTTDDFEVRANGGGIYCYDADLTLDNVTISGNQTTGPDYSSGGGLYLNTCQVNVMNSIITNNNAQYSGGGIYIYTDASNSVSFSDVIISNNETTEDGYGFGGGVIIYSSTTHNAVQFDRVIFDSNTSSLDGGAIQLEGKALISNSIFVDNVATGNDLLEAYGDGGAINVYDQDYVSLNMAHSTLVGNSAGGAGGAIHKEAFGNDSTENIRSSILSDNTGQFGGDNCYTDGAETLTSGGYNIIADDTGCNFTTTTGDVMDADAGLAATSLQNLGVNTEIFPDRPSTFGVIPLNADSIALDKVPQASCEDAVPRPLGIDIRGYTRLDGAYCDIGAHERDQVDPVISIHSGTDIIECGVDTWTDAGATISDDFATGLAITATYGTVDTSIPLVYPIIYASTDEDYDGNTAPAASRNVLVQDTTKPTLTVIGSANMTIEEGEIYTELGATASDACDISVSVITGGDTVNTSIPGTYTVKYTATDNDGRVRIATRTVTVVANDEPEAAGTIASVSQSGGTLTITYENSATEEVIPFNGKSNFRYYVSSNNEALVVSNGRAVKVYVDGELTQKATVVNRPRKKKHFRMKLGKLYANKQYDTVAVLSTGKRNAKLVVWRLNADNELKKKAVAKYAVDGRAYMKLKLNPKNQRIVTKVGPVDNVKTVKYKLTKKGLLKGL